MRKHAPIPDDPICPMCGSQVRSGELVVFGHGELVHVKCHPSSDAIARFLRAHPDGFFCHTCLKHRLGIDWEAVQKGVAQLRTTGAFRVSPQRCTGCGAARVSITALPGAR